MTDLFYLLASMVALFTALLVGGLVEKIIVRPIGKRMGWWDA
jgi:hypothetical protein